MAEMQAMREIPMTMEDWEKRLSGFLQLWDREILQDAGKVTAELAKMHAHCGGTPQPRGWGGGGAGGRDRRGMRLAGYLIQKPPTLPSFRLRVPSRSSPPSLKVSFQRETVKPFCFSSPSQVTS